jgi:arylsulfatase A-like enzyme
VLPALFLLSCQPTPPPAEVPVATPAPEAVAPIRTATALDQPAYGLAHLLDAAVVTLPERSWPGEIADRFTPTSLEPAGNAARVAMTLPESILRAHLVKGGDPFSHAPAGVSVTVGGEELAFDPKLRKPGTFAYDDKGLRVRADDAADLVVHMPSLADAQRALEADPTDPTWPEHTAADGFRSNHGLLLPAPASATWTLKVPPKGRLQSSARLLPPVVPTDLASDGAEVIVEVTHDGQTTELARVAVAPGKKTPKLRANLARFSGKTVALTIRTEGGATDDLDHVFVIEPQLYTPSDDPKRTVLLFLDTLRRDRLGTYGYTARPVSPAIDAFAETATVFDNARTVAPWTLPSVRTALTGNQPERWADSTNLAERLGALGWSTVARSTNAFVSHTFDMDRGWSTFEFAARMPAPKLADYVERALGWYGDRDALFLVQFMDVHLPYEEPEPYRSMFVDAEPADTSFLGKLRKLKPGQPGFEAQRAYVEARYDNNTRAIDDAVARILAALDPDDTVVIFADHGEEFWEHGGFEHGHAFWDELLRVPLIVRSPDLPAGRVEAPVSLLDLTPTLLDLQGQPHDGLQGRSLRAVAHGEAGAAESLAKRPQAFGRPLYGADGWGVVVDGDKWLARGGFWGVYDLAADPGETKNLARPATLKGKPEALSAALDRPVHEVWRVQLRAGPRLRGATWEISHPDGLDDAWLTYDPRGRFRARDVAVEGGRVVLRSAEDGAVPAAVDLVGRGSPVGLTVTARAGDQVVTGTVEDAGAAKRLMLQVGTAGLGAYVERTWSPEPVSGTVEAFAPEMSDELQALGYVE